MALVSVIIPAYNPGRFLEVAVRSVIAQTFQDWELVVVDDGSEEDLSFVAELDARVRVLRQENKGVSMARNVGIAQSSSEFVAFLDADDVWLPHKLEVQVRLMRERPEVALCHTQFEMINAEGERVGDGFDGAFESYRELLGGCGIGASSVVVRRSVLSFVGVCDPISAYSEDYDLWLRIARYYALARVNETSMQYRVHGQNASSDYNTMFVSAYNTLDKHRVAARKRGDKVVELAAIRGQKNIERVYGTQAFDRVRLSVRKRDAREAMPHLKFALRHSPVQVAQSLWSFVRRK